MLMKPPGGGVPINQYPIEVHRQEFLCATPKCKGMFPVETGFVMQPGKIPFTGITGYLWKCDKCGVAQRADLDLPKSKSRGMMKPKTAIKKNGTGKDKPINDVPEEEGDGVTE